MAVATPSYADWLRPSQVDALSGAMHDPASLRELRATAFRAFRELPLEPDPLYRKYGYFAGVDLTGIVPESTGPALPRPPRQPGTIHVLHDAAGTHLEVPSLLRDHGVRAWVYPEGLVAGELSTDAFLRGAETPTDRLSALGTALINRGVRIELPDGLTTPVRVKDVTVFSSPHEALSVRRSIRVGAGARLLMSEEVFGRGPPPDGQRLYGSSTDLELTADAQAAYLTLHAPDTRLVSIYSRHATVGAQSRLGWVWTGFGGFRTKLRNRSSMPGQGADVEDLQAVYGAESQAYDSAIHLTHIGTDTHGQSITRGVFKDESRGMSRGLVRIEKEARRTVSFLSEHAMLLSRGTRSDTIPILEILCRDVKATHSSSVAPVDPERVFYLESRGISQPDAIRMIGEGFLSHVLERAPFAGLREILYPYLAARWDGQPVDWGDGSQVALPPLEFRGVDAGTDWRFDAKLR
jgi:Fe-S cluster assembly scaffold protein SufB